MQIIGNEQNWTLAVLHTAIHISQHIALFNFTAHRMSNSLTLTAAFISNYLPLTSRLMSNSQHFQLALTLQLIVYQTHYNLADSVPNSLSFTINQNAKLIHVRDYIKMPNKLIFYNFNKSTTHLHLFLLFFFISS